MARRSARPSRPRTSRVAWLVHRTLGIGIGVLILLMSVTGGLLVVHHDLERLLYPERHVVVPPGETAGTAAPVAPRGERLRRLAADAPPGYRPLRIELAGERDEAEKYLFVAPDGRTRWAALVNPHSGDFLWQGPDQALFTSWLLHLHMHLRTGGWGYVVTATAGACLLLLGVTGLFVYGGRLGALWRHPIRLGHGWRVAVTDLHRWLGLVSLYFCIVLGLTGAIYAAKSAPGQIAAPKPLGAPFELRQLAPLEPVLAEAAARYPKAELSRIALPTNTSAPLAVTVLHREAPVWRKFSRLEFDPATGALRVVRDAAKAPPAERFASMLTPLHFGLYGSIATKVAYAIGGFAPALLAATGILMWSLRRRRAFAQENATTGAMPKPFVPATDRV